MSSSSLQRGGSSVKPSQSQISRDVPSTPCPPPRWIQLLPASQHFHPTLTLSGQPPTSFL